MPNGVPVENEITRAMKLKKGERIEGVFFASLMDIISLARWFPRERRLIKDLEYNSLLQIMGKVYTKGLLVTTDRRMAFLRKRVDPMGKYGMQLLLSIPHNRIIGLESSGDVIQLIFSESKGANVIYFRNIRQPWRFHVPEKGKEGDKVMEEFLRHLVSIGLFKKPK
jgi:hypothetical protein